MVGVLARTMINAAATKKLNPMPKLAFVDGSGEFQSMKIRAAQTGRSGNMCVHWSSRSARVNVERRAFHQIAKEIAARTEKVSSGGNRKIDDPSEAASTVALLSWAWFSILAFCNYLLLSSPRQTGGKLRTGLTGFLSKTWAETKSVALLVRCCMLIAFTL